MVSFHVGYVGAMLGAGSWFLGVSDWVIRGGLLGADFSEGVGAIEIISLGEVLLFCIENTATSTAERNPRMINFFFI